jgi:hypothetical protein
MRATTRAKTMRRELLQGQRQGDESYSKNKDRELRATEGTETGR